MPLATSPLCEDDSAICAKRIESSPFLRRTKTAGRFFHFHLPPFHLSSSQIKYLKRYRRARAPLRCWCRSLKIPNSKPNFPGVSALARWRDRKILLLARHASAEDDRRFKGQQVVRACAIFARAWLFGHVNRFGFCVLTVISVFHDRFG